MISGIAVLWPQPLTPVGSLAVSALVASIPLIVILVLMGGLRKSGLIAASTAWIVAGLLAAFVWHMPATLLIGSAVFGFLYAAWPILWIVFSALWLYNLTQDTGQFDVLRCWMAEHASGDPCIQAILVAFCFGALLEGSAGFGAPVAVTACLLVAMGFEKTKAVVVALIANTAPVAFGGLGIPIVALAGVTGLNLMQLSSMVGRQVPVLSFVLPFYLVWVVAKGKGIRRTWPVAFIAGATFGLAQFIVSNLWGPYAADIIAACLSIIAIVAFLQIWRTKDALRTFHDTDGMTGNASERVSGKQALRAWMPWILLSVVMVLWTYYKMLPAAQITFPIPMLHNGILITLYQKSYSALYVFQPMGAGTAVLAATILTAAFLRSGSRVFFTSGAKTVRQLRIPSITVLFIVSLAYIYNYSGMVYTLGAACARVGPAFPLLSSYLGWVACFLSGSDTASNLLFGNLQVAAAHQLHLSPILLAATNSTGAVTGKMISPQNIAVGVTTVGLIGQEGRILRATFWHSIILATLLSILAFLQAYWATWMIP
jgi:glycolate permease